MAAASAIQRELPQLAEDIARGTLDVSAMRLPMCLSGACFGADETFGELCQKAKHGLVHFLGPGDEEWASTKAKAEQSDCFYHVGQELLDGPTISAAFEVAGTHRVLGNQRSEGWEAKVAVMAARRNFLQVRCASAVYVIGWRIAEGMDQFTGRSPVGKGETPPLDVGGGTGWACQWYADRFVEGGEDPSLCQLYFFDDAGPPWARRDEVTMGKWSSWDVKMQQWVPVAGLPPQPSGLYAGIGATRLSESAAAAISALYSGIPQEIPR